MKFRFIYIFLIAILQSFELGDKSYSLTGNYNQPGTSRYESVDQKYPSIPLEGLINAEEYLLGPGDGIYINIVTSNKIINLNLSVSPTGDLLIPVVGLISLNGLTLQDGIVEIKNKCLEKYNDSDISVTLSSIRKIKIKALGGFEESGFYTSTPINRVSDIYNEIVSRNSKNLELNKRNIILQRDETDYYIDLLKFHLFGNDSQNPFLQTGDVLKFNYIDEYISISGGVQSPGEYPFLRGETLNDIVTLAGGFKFNAAKDDIIITRYALDGTKTDILVKSKDFDQTLVSPFDFINIKVQNKYLIHDIVEIKGEVVNPGFYSVIEGSTSVKELIDKAGGYTLLADRDKILFSSKYNEIHLQNMSASYHDYIDKSYKIDNPDKVRLLYSSNKVYTERVLGYKLYDDDVIEVPKNHPFVELVGAVKYPGLYEYDSNYSMNYYISQAGGITGSESRDIFIIKAHTNHRIKFKGDKIESGDIIYVTEKINWDRRTKILDTVSVTQAIASTLSMILTILIATGSINGV